MVTTNNTLQDSSVVFSIADSLSFIATVSLVNSQQTSNPIICLVSSGTYANYQNLAHPFGICSSPTQCNELKFTSDFVF